MKAILVSVVLAMSIGMSSWADAVTTNGVTWTYDVVNGSVELNGKWDDDQGAYIRCIPNDTTGQLVIPPVLAGMPVTSIGEYAFFNCRGLTSVTVPSSVTNISESAFDGCNLTVTANGLGWNYKPIAGGVEIIGRWETVWYGDEGWEMSDEVFIPAIPSDTQGSLEIPSELAGMPVTSIGESAFESCHRLTAVTIPASVKLIGRCAFARCKALKSVTLLGSAPALDSDVFLETPANLVCHAAGPANEWVLLSGRKIVFDSNGSESVSRPEVVTNFVFSTVTNFVCLTVTNVIHTSSTVNHYTTVTNVVEYVPEAGTAPEEIYSARAGTDAGQMIAGAAGWDVMELPKGMIWDSETGRLSGTPVQSGTYDIILVSGSGANTRMMRTTVEVANFDPIIGYIGTAFAWKGLPVSLFASYANLPKGLKWNSSTKALAGVPTVKGDFSRKTTYGDLVDFKIRALPEGVTGTFNGIVTNVTGGTCPVVVSTSTAGKITAKMVKGSTTYTLTGVNWTGVVTGDDGHRVFTAKLKATGGLSAVVVVDADAVWNADSLVIMFAGGAVAGFSGTAQRNVFAKVEKAKSLAASLAGTYTFDLEPVSGGYALVVPPMGKVGKMSVVLKTTGVATLSGKLDSKTIVSATATVHVDADDNPTLVFFYKGKKFNWAW